MTSDHLGCLNTLEQSWWCTLRGVDIMRRDAVDIGSNEVHEFVHERRSNLDELYR